MPTFEVKNPWPLMNASGAYERLRFTRISVNRRS